MPFTPYKPTEQAEQSAGGFKPYVPPEEPAPMATSQKPASTFGLWEGLKNGIKKTSQFFDSAGTAVRDFNIGALKGAGSTIVGMGELGSRALESGYNATIGAITGVKAQEGAEAAEAVKKVALTPENTAQKVGFGAEQLAEFFIPAGGAAKAAMVEKAGVLMSKAPKLAKGVEMGTKAVIEGAEQAARTAAQEGEINGDVSMAGLFGAGSQVAGKIIQKGLSSLGDAFYALAIPSTVLERGKDIRKQLNVGRAASETGISLTRKNFTKKIGDKIAGLGRQLDSAVDTATKSGVGTNFDEIAESALKHIDEINLGKEIQASPIDLEDAKTVIQETVERYKKMFGGREMSANELQKLKRDIGSGLIKVFDRNMGAPIKAKALTETNLYGQLDGFLDKNVPGYKQLNEKLAPLLEGKERLMKKGGYSGLLTDVVAGSIIGSTGGSLLEDPIGFLKNAAYGVLLKRGVNSTAAKTTAGTIANQLGKALQDPKFYQWFRQAAKLSQSSED